MCGRFYLYVALTDLAVAFDVPTGIAGAAPLPNLAPRYNIAPTQSTAVIRLGEQSGAREIAALHWGLVPGWSKDTRIAARTINARSESAHHKPAFRQAFTARRCLVPANGYYEWPILEGVKTPVSTHTPDRSVIAMAGLWERWTGPRQAPLPTPLESFTILTCPPNEAMAPLHDRMPVVLSEAADRAAWLDPDASVDDLRALLRPAPNDALVWAPVDRRVGKVQFDDPAILAPLTAPTEAAVPKQLGLL